MNRIRWWLARRIAPTPVMWDAFPGESDGVFIYIRRENVTSACKADKFRLKSRRVLKPWYRDQDLDRVFGDIYSTCTTFVGTVA